MNDYEILKHGHEYYEHSQSPAKKDAIVLRCSVCGCVVKTKAYDTVTQYNEVYHHFTCPECKSISGSEEVYSW